MKKIHSCLWVNEYGMFTSGLSLPLLVYIDFCCWPGEQNTANVGDLWADIITSTHASQKLYRRG